MATIASLLVNLKANTFNFDKGMRGSAKSVTALGSIVKSTSTHFAAFGAAIAGAFSVAKATSFIKDQFELLDSLAKTSDRLGIQTEQLHGLQLAARLGGASTEAMNTALLKMLKVIGDAKNLGGATAKTFEMIGLSAEKLAGMSTEKAFFAISDAISQIPDKATQTSVSLAIFGRGAADLINTIRGGSGPLRDIIGEVIAFGAATRGQASLVETADDAMEKLRTAISILGGAFAIQLAPFITKTSDELRGFIKQTVGVNKMQGAFMGLAQSVAFMVDVFNKIREGLLQLKVVVLVIFSAIAKGLAIVIDGFDDFIDALNAVAAKLGLIDEGITIDPRSEAKMEALTGFVENIDQQISDTQVTIGEMKMQNSTWFDWQQTIKQAAKDADAFKQNLGGAVPVANEIATTIGTQLKRVVDKAALYLSGKASAVDAWEWVAKQTRAESGGLPAAGAKVMDTLKSGFHGFLDVFGGVIGKIHDAGKALSDAVRESQSLLSSLATPDERFAEMVAQIQEFADMGMKGFVGRVDELIGRARTQIFGETPVAALDQAAQRGGPGLVERGSQEAFRALSRFENGQQSNLTRTERLQEDANRELKQANRNLQDIKRGIAQPADGQTDFY